MTALRMISGGLLLLGTVAMGGGAAAAETIIDQWNNITAPEAPKLAAPTVAAKTTAFLILDIEERTCNKERRPRCLDTVPVIAEFLGKARAAGMPIAYSTTTASPPEAMLPAVRPNPGEPVVKASVDKFLGTDLESILKGKGVGTVIVCGTASHGAVMHTATAAAQRKLKVVLPVDCQSAEDPFIEKATVWLLATGPATRQAITLTTLSAIKID